MTPTAAARTRRASRRLPPLRGRRPRSSEHGHAASESAAGSALVEALAALTLLAVAGTILATAATASLRALRHADLRYRLVAIAARELSSLQSTATPAAGSARAAEPGVPGLVSRVTTVERAGGLHALAITVHAQPPSHGVTLTTRTLAP